MSRPPSKYPSHCRMQHAGWIGYNHNDWPNDERCPVCRLQDELAAAEDKNATLMRDLELACRDLAAVKLSRDAAEANLAEYEGTEGRCPDGHNKRFTYDLSELGGNVGCVACERDELARRLADEVRHADELAATLNAACGHDANDYNCDEWPPGTPCRGCAGDKARELALAAHAARRAARDGQEGTR